MRQRHANVEKVQNRKINAEPNLLLEHKRVISFEQRYCNKHQEVADNILNRVEEIERCHSDVVNPIKLEFEPTSSVSVVEMPN